MKLYAVGVGPGNPEDVTIRAVRVLSECEILYIPVKKEGAPSFAYEIVEEYINPKAKLIELHFPMHYQQEQLLEKWKENGRIIGEELRDNPEKKAAFIVIGDITMYSTYMYIQKDLREQGIDIELVPGITSYSSSAAIVGSPLAMGEENLAIVSASRDRQISFEEVFSLFENVVIMKPSHNPGAIKKALIDHGLEQNFRLVYKAGTKEQEITRDIEELEKGIPYLSTMIVKKGGFDE